jgi:hypothetical protein
VEHGEIDLVLRRGLSAVSPWLPFKLLKKTLIMAVHIASYSKNDKFAAHFPVTSVQT